MLSYNQFKKCLLVSKVTFTPKARRNVPKGHFVYKKIAVEGLAAVAVMVVTEPGVVPVGSNGINKGKYKGKFRVRAVLVLDIVDEDGRHHTTATSERGGTYNVGQVFTPDGFTTDLNDDCGRGVHCFATPKKAWDL